MRRVGEILVHVVMLPVYLVGIIYLTLHDLWVNH